MDDAPSENPKSCSMAVSPFPSRPPNTRYRTAIPAVPKATTVNPITAPLEKATRRAAARLVVAANVVRTAAPVAVRIPTQPASAESDAPTRKLTPVRNAFSGRENTSTRNMMATKPASTVYSVLRNAMAPARMSAAIRCMTSVPGS